MRRILPFIGVLASAVLFAVAAARYPGGYDWLHQSVSSLLQPTALNGVPNAARALAALAVVVFATSLALVFNTIAMRGPTRFHRKTIQTAGVGSMVYTAFVVTPMHDVVVGIALLFFVTAMLTILHRLFVQRRFGMLGAGVMCLGLTLSNATMYYGDVLYGFLPIIQKISVPSWVVWLFGLYVGDSQPAAGAGEDDVSLAGAAAGLRE